MAVAPLRILQQGPAPTVVDGDLLREQIRQAVSDAVRQAREGSALNPGAPQRGGPGERDGRSNLPAGRGATMGHHVNFERGGIPQQAVDISLAFFTMCAVLLIGWPIARALGRRIERRGDHTPLDPALADQLHRIEHAVEAMSIEIERISESQRFMAKVQSGGRAAPVAPDAKPS